jgi:uncharacterized cupin superfamily protein
MTEWHVRNARELEWTEGGPVARVELWIDGAVVHEPHQEGFLVLRGACTLRVDGEERPLRQWDYFHCPPGVAHVVTGASEEPALVLAVGSRVGGGVATYPEDPDPREAYAAYGEAQKVASPL